MKIFIGRISVGDGPRLKKDNNMSFLNAIPLIGNIVNKAGDIISEAVTDKDKKIELENQLKTLQITSEAKLLEMEHDEKLAQVEVAKLNAKSNDSYVRRARPTILWICAIGLGYQWLLHPIMLWALSIAPIWYPEAVNITPPPTLNLTELSPILLGMLGLSTLRTTEKIKGVVGK